MHCHRNEEVRVIRPHLIAFRGPTRNEGFEVGGVLSVRGGHTGNWLNLAGNLFGLLT